MLKLLKAVLDLRRMQLAHTCLMSGNPTKILFFYLFSRLFSFTPFVLALPTRLHCRDFILRILAKGMKAIIIFSHLNSIVLLYRFKEVGA